MMQHRAEMPKSVGQGVSLGLHGPKQVPVSGLAVWVTGQWEVLVKLAVAESFGGDFLSVDIFVCDAGIGCYILSYRTVWKVWPADCQRSGKLFVSSFSELVLNIATLYRTRSWCICYVMVLRTVCSLRRRSGFLLFTQSANQHTHTFSFLFIKTYLKFLKTLLHVSVIRPSSGSL